MDRKYTIWEVQMNINLERKKEKKSHNFENIYTTNLNICTTNINICTTNIS
jgi:hypothetical protein